MFLAQLAFSTVPDGTTDPSHSICCHLASRGEGRSEGVYQICSPCQPLTLFGWPVPGWLELAAIIGFAALVIGLIVYIAGLSMLWWGPDDYALIKEWRRDRTAGASTRREPRDA